MAIDDNSWEAGYECGIKDQKRASDAVILELNQQVGVLQALLASRCKVSPDPTEPCQSQALSGTPDQT